MLFRSESVDKETVPELPADFSAESQFEEGLLGGVVTLTGPLANGGRWNAVPFYTLANRGPAWQEVWVPQQGYAPRSDWWHGQLYRPL